MSCLCGGGEEEEEEFYCEVLLLDETTLQLTSQQHGVKRSSRGSALLGHVFAHLDLVESDYFGLRYCDSGHQTHWLEPDRSLGDHRDLMETGPPFTLYFGVKFYARDPCQLKEEITRYQLFLQVKQDVLQGRLPVTHEEAALLASFALQAELGDYDAAKAAPGYVSAFRFVPGQTAEVEERAEALHGTLTGLVPAEAELQFLRRARALDMYGVDLHHVTGEHQREYMLGLSPTGISVYLGKAQVAHYFWPRITRVNFKGTQFELRVRGKDDSETSYFFESATKTACKHLWKCCVEFHTFFRLPEARGPEERLARRLGKMGSLGSRHHYSGRTVLQVDRELASRLPRPNQVVRRTRSKTYPKRLPAAQQDVKSPPQQMSQRVEDTSRNGTTKIQAPAPIRSSQMPKVDGSPDVHRNRPSAPWEDGSTKSGLFTAQAERNQSPKFPHQRRRNPSGSDGEPGRRGRRRRTGAQSSGDDSEPSRHRKRRSHSRGGAPSNGSGNESEASGKDRRHRGRSRQENELVDSAPQWEEVLRRQHERSQNDPAHRRSRHRSRSRSPDKQAREELWKHIERELVDPIGYTEDQLKDIPYTKVETRGDPVKIRHSQSPHNSRVNHRRSHASEGERSVLAELHNSRSDLVEPLPVMVAQRQAPAAAPAGHNPGAGAVVAAARKERAERRRSGSDWNGSITDCASNPRACE
ncbi:band 4.1-like protein 4A isoform X2 [Lethenteron reissneri]|uniref:band 4.1-like protein 4A isoform X2 n=1 Tax=Lethenteron reissneri TaxID=7753 RepID=UPI002AB7F0CF|nr:band 4.1-like protein 4A isoform X2 [Lethenteron reissneri]